MFNAFVFQETAGSGDNVSYQEAGDKPPRYGKQVVDT
jgi:hypothetical protein